jgi:HK97 family phage major capsid protein
MELKDVKTALEAASAEVKEMVSKMEAETKANGEALTETKTKMEAAEAKAADLAKQVETLDAGLKDVQAKAARPGFGKDEKKTLGQMFVESDVFAEVKQAQRGNGKPFEVKQITGTTGSALALIRPDRDPEVYRTIGGMRQIRIADLIPSVPTQSGAVEIMRQSGFTNQAGPQQAASSPSSAQGGGEFLAKNQSNMTWELVTVPVRTIAHWVPASRQALSDAPMLQGLIDTELTYGLQLESDAQLLFGDGTGQNLTGIMNDAAINDIGELPIGTATADVPAAMIDHIRKGITACQLSKYYNVNGLVLNPEDWEILETAKATDGHYLRVPFAATAGDVPFMWRVPVIVTNAMTSGNFLLGDWTMGAKRYTREGVSVRVSESHSDYFVRNGVAVLAEYRECLAINRPKAFTKGQFSVETT